ncbi:MAG: MmcQ/YjbR family DNA-binding protein [Bacteroidota bacterium]
MNIEDIRIYCLSKKAVSECLPFDDSTLVFKVGSKLFALLDLNKADSLNLKAEPEKAIQLREHYPEIVPGFHMNKIHWNTVYINGNLSEKMIKELIDDSYQLVYAKLTKKERLDLESI